ncbi:glycogen synthase GlgA [Elioraea rosea]|uniref:glycogen synthase GlgA n=1 Tax=Elioraea rosea TaxID=2492390 RepID=UPI001183B08F|nr:glycogen synthase GlgA [Elioraea rosea]
MRVLAVASEAYPLVKTGGLADVAGALPAALAEHGVAVTTLLPGYPAVRDALTGAVACALPDGHQLLAGRAGGLDLLVLDAPALFDRPGSPYLAPGGYDWPDNAQRFAALGRSAAIAARGAGTIARFDLVHAHDWQAALAPAYLAFAEGPRIPSVMTIHNMAFQGQFPPAVFPALGLPQEAFTIEGVEYYGMVGYLKAGLHYADRITTVSPTYAREIATPEGGMGLDGLIRARAGRVLGVVNGIDVTVWNPAADRTLRQRYGAGTLEARAANRAAIEQAFGLGAEAGPIFAVVSRLTWQKGMDLLAEALPALMAEGGRLALLGTGDAALEGAFLAAAQRYPGRVGVRIGFDEGLSHRIFGGADAIVVPSRFEPCGLTQLYGLRYGCVPVVSRVGGLADTVIDANEAAVEAGVATGVQFSPVTVAALEAALARAVALFRDPEAWQSIQRAGMRTDLSWSRRAAAYAALFREVAG